MPISAITSTRNTTIIKKIVVGTPIGTVSNSDIVTSLAGLTDTNVAGVQDGYLLIYNGSTGKWDAVDEITIDGGTF